VAQFVKEFHELSNERHEFTVKRCVSLEARVAELERLVKSQRYDEPQSGRTTSKIDTDELIRQRDAWQETARSIQRNCDYYQNLVVQVGEILGEVAHVMDDGDRSPDVLCAKVPELVARLENERCYLLNQLNALAMRHGGQLVPHPNGDGTSSGRIVYPGGVGSPKDLR
jgi:hypothetical protein